MRPWAARSAESGAMRLRKAWARASRLSSGVAGRAGFGKGAPGIGLFKCGFIRHKERALVIRLLNNSDSFIFAKGCLPGSLDLSQDLLSFSPPDVPLGFEVMPGEVLHDGIDQLAHAAEAAGQDRLLAQVSEEAFDQIHPG